MLDWLAVSVFQILAIQSIVLIMIKKKIKGLHENDFIMASKINLLA